MPKARIARGGSSAERRSSPPGIDRDQRPVAHRQLPHGGDGQGEVEPGRAAQGVGVPGIVGPGRQHAGGVRRCGDPHAGPHVAHRPRVLEQDQGLRLRLSKHRRQVDCRAAGDRDDAGAWRLGHQLRHDLSVDRSRTLGKRSTEIRRQLRFELAQLPRIGTDRIEHLGAEAQRVLEGVKALEDGQVGVAASRAVAADQGALVGIAHRRIITRPRRRARPSSPRPTRPGR